MAQSTSPTLEQLIAQQAAASAQQAELAKQIAALSIPTVEAAVALVGSEAVTQIVADATALRDKLAPGLARDNLQNIIDLFASAPNNLAVALDDLRRSAGADTQAAAA